MMKNHIKYGFALSVVVIFCLTFFLSVRAYFAGGYEGQFTQSKVTELNDLWTKTPDVEESSDKDSYLVYSYTTQEEEPLHQVLAIESYWSMMEVFVGETKVFECGNDNLNRGMLVRWIKLPEDISGKTIRIRTLDNEKSVDRKLIGSCCLGQKDAILFTMLKKSSYAVVFSIMSLVAGLGLLMITLIYRKKISSKFVTAITYLSLFILTSGIWVLTDSRLLQFFTCHASVVSLVCYVSLYMMPVFFLMFIREILSKHYRMLEYLAYMHEGLLIVSILIYQITRIPMYRLIYVQHLMVLISILFVMRYCLKELNLYQKEWMRTLIKGMMFLFIFTLIAVIDFHIDDDLTYAFLFSIGMLVFAIMIGRVGIFRFFYRMEIIKHVTQYKNLHFFDPLSGMGNEKSLQAFREREDLPEELTYIRFRLNDNFSDDSEKDNWKQEQLILDAADCIRTIFEPKGKCFRLSNSEFLVILQKRKSEEVKQHLKNLEEVIQNKNRHRKEPIEIIYGFAQMPQECDEEVELYDLAEERVQE